MSLTAALRDLNKLNAFVRVAERRSFTKAAAGPAHDALGHQQAYEGAGGSARLQPAQPLHPWHRAHRCRRGAVSELPEDAGEARRLCGRGAQPADRPVSGRCASRPTATTPSTCWSPLIGSSSGAIPACAFTFPSLADDSAVRRRRDSTSSSRARSRPCPGLIDRDLGAIRHVVCASPKYFQRFGRPKKPAGPARAQLSGESPVARRRAGRSRTARGRCWSR